SIAYQLIWINIFGKSPMTLRKESVKEPNIRQYVTPRLKDLQLFKWILRREIKEPAADPFENSVYGLAGFTPMSRDTRALVHLYLDPCYPVIHNNLFCAETRVWLRKYVNKHDSASLRGGSSPAVSLHSE